MKNKKWTFVTTKNGNVITRNGDYGLIFIDGKLGATVHHSIATEEVLNGFPISETLYIHDGVELEPIPSYLDELHNYLLD